MRNYTDEEIWASLEKKIKPILKDNINVVKLPSSFNLDGATEVAVKTIPAYCEEVVKDGDLCVFLAKETTNPEYYPAYGTILIATLKKVIFAREMWFNNRCYNQYIKQIKKVIPLEC